MNFLAKIGKWRHIELVTPMVVVTVSTVYPFMQGMGHDIWKKFYVSQSKSGQEETFTKNMRLLIQQTAADLNGKILKRRFRKEIYSNDPKVGWFVSSTLEPVILGQHDSKKGSLVGVPSHFNYEKVEELPDNIFGVTKIKWFKRKVTSASDQKDREEMADIMKSAGDTSNGAIEIETFNRNTPYGQKFAESMILSDSAKKFALAKQLFLGDCERIWLKSGLILVSLSIGFLMGRIAKIKLRNRHLMERIPAYLISGCFACINTLYTTDMIDNYYEFWSEKMAASVSAEYKRGAIEYLEKSQTRNIALKMSLKSLAKEYKDNGDRVNPFIRHKFLPLSTRLERIKAIEINEEDTAESELQEKQN